MTERRSRRSQVRAEALALFLDSQRSKLRARGLVLATRDGQVLAAAGPSSKRLARAVIQIHETPEVAAKKTMNVATWCLRAGDIEVVLASDGGRLSYDLGSGVKRILTS